MLIIPKCLNTKEIKTILHLKTPLGKTMPPIKL